MTALLLRSGKLLDVESGEYTGGDLLCLDGRIAEIGTGLTAPTDAQIVDLSGASVLPGLIDCHVHVTAATTDLSALPSWSPSYTTAHAGRIMAQMLARGFTTVRDVSGADFGLADAQAEGLIRGPRLAFCGEALRQTGGHGDTRPRGMRVHDDDQCCAGLGRIADGVDAVRMAARDELRKGAHHIKVMAGGGLVSVTDRIDSTQYSLEELRAIVEEAEAANRYVAAHAYTTRSVNHALHAGVRSIEHGNLMDECSVAELWVREAFLVPTLVAYWVLKTEGRDLGLSDSSWRKVDEVFRSGLEVLDMADLRGVQIAYGTDLLGGMHRYQNEEFRIRAMVQQPLEVIRSATNIAADLLGMSGEVGTLRVGALADLVVVDGDPLEEISALADPKHMRHVVQGGVLV